MTRDEILRATKREHEKFLACITDIPDDVIAHDRVIDWWSLKDVLGHVTFWYLVATKFLREYQQNGVPQPLGLDDPGIDALNHREAAMRRDYSLARIRAELDAAYHDLLAETERLSDAEVNKILSAPWNPDEQVTLERLIAVNAYGHLPEHIEQVNKWKSAH
ncbi:MAG: ClbS/DfsB family four-helix bundle protein [Chloroflexi bacterium]|nr:ClbS/DfsB family four-helix bundle protein [Chloroflexota bacterium]